MIRGLLGKKVGMTQIFDKDGNVIPVTVVEAGPCTVLGLIENSSHKKVKLGFESVKESSLKKPDAGFFKKIGAPPLRFIQEFESSDNKDYQVGQEIKADVFKPGDFVDVSGISRGKGFQGGMKRWHWKGGGAAHGSMHHRRVGSIGSSAWPSRVFRGHHMPGHMGAKKVSVQGLRVMQVDAPNNLLLIKGAVPGHRTTLLTIILSKKKVYQSLDVKKAVAAKSRNPMKHSKASTKGKT
jgi:large subunit ribosomal protein L3